MDFQGTHEKTVLHPDIAPPSPHHSFAEMATSRGSLWGICPVRQARRLELPYLPYLQDLPTDLPTPFTPLHDKCSFDAAVGIAR